MAKKIEQALGQLSFMAALDSTPLDSNIVTPSDSRFNAFIDRWSKSRFFGLDIETTYVDHKGDGLNHFKGRIRLIQIALPAEEEVLIVDMFDTVPVIFMDTLKKTCESKTQHQVGAFIQFDLTWLQVKYGIQSSSPYCIRILSVLRWCGIKWDSRGRRMTHTLKAIYARLFGKEISKEQQRSDWSQPQLSTSQLNYAALDAKAALQCFLELSKQLKQFDRMSDIQGNPCKLSLIDIAKAECFAIPVFCEIAITGQPIDLELAKDVRKQYTEAMRDLYQPVQEALLLPYSASADRLASAVWEKLDILLVEEVVTYDEDGKEEDKDCRVELVQMKLFGKQMPALEPDTKLSTSSSNLFYYYTQTKNDLLIRISLCRSLKKAVDSLDALVDSAQIDGYAKGRYTSLGSTGSGRSTCSGDKKSSLKSTNLQNITGTVEHDLLKKYNLPPIRSIISNKGKDSMWLVDLSGSHLRIAALNSGDETLTDILSYKDPHRLVTSAMLKLDGKEFTPEYCQEHKKDAEIAYYRAIAKVATYTMFNAGTSHTYQAALLKSYVDVTLDACELAEQALKETFPGYSAYALQLKAQATKHIVDLPEGRYVQYRTHDGRLFHVEVREKQGKFGSYDTFKLGEVTSSMLISPEAYAMKIAGAKILDFKRANSHLPIKLNSFVHDDYSGEDLTEDKVFVKFAYQAIAEEFHKFTGGEQGSGMMLGDEYALKCLMSNYSEK